MTNRGDIIRLVRRNLRQKQCVFATLLDVKQPMLSMMERGERDVTEAHIRTIADLLNEKPFAIRMIPEMSDEALAEAQQNPDGFGSEIALTIARRLGFDDRFLGTNECQDAYVDELTCKVTSARVHEHLNACMPMVA